MGAPGAARGRCGRRRGAGTAAPDPRTPSRRSATAPKVAKGVFSAPGSPALAAVLAPAATTSAARAPPAFASLRSPPAMTSNDAFPRRASLRRTEARAAGACGARGGIFLFSLSLLFSWYAGVCVVVSVIVDQQG